MRIKKKAFKLSSLIFFPVNVWKDDEINLSCYFLFDKQNIWIRFLHSVFYWLMLTIIFGRQLFFRFVDILSEFMPTKKISIYDEIRKWRMCSYTIFCPRNLPCTNDSSILPTHYLFFIGHFFLSFHIDHRAWEMSESDSLLNKTWTKLFNAMVQMFKLESMTRNAYVELYRFVFII
jgi:hypothetical protein